MRGREAAARPVLAALVAWLPARVLADLPVHCLRHQLTGHWTFFVGPRSATPQACGHHTPGEVRDVVLQEGHAEVVGVLDTVRRERAYFALHRARHDKVLGSGLASARLSSEKPSVRCEAFRPRASIFDPDKKLEIDDECSDEELWAVATPERFAACPGLRTE